MEAIKLGECAEIFRCQLPRKRLDELELRQERAVLGGEEAGFMPCKLSNGSVLAYEIMSHCIDPDTGIVDEKLAKLAELELTPKGNRYLLRAGDMVCVHVGNRERLGKVGLVHEASLAFPGRSFCLIRPRGINPIWLFHYLREDKPWQGALDIAESKRTQSMENVQPGQQTRQTRSSASRPGQLLSLSVEDIRCIDIPVPDADAVERILELHDRILANAEKMRMERTELRRNNARIHTIFALLEKRIDYVVHANHLGCQR